MDKLSFTGIAILLVLFACDTPTDFFIRDNPNDPYLPSLGIHEPANDALFHVDESISLVAWVADNTTPLQNLDISLRSDIDGLIKTVNADEEGNIRENIVGLSAALHTLTLSVTNDHGFQWSESVNVNTKAPPGVVFSEAALINNRHIQLKWQESTDPFFLAYKLYRISSRGEKVLVKQETERGNTSYQDYPHLDSLYTYNVVTSSTSSEYEHPGNPTTVKRQVFTGNYSDRISDVIKYPDHPILGIRQSNSIVFYNYEINKLLGEIPLAHRFDAGDNGHGLELYVNRRNGYLEIYDAFTFNVKESIRVNSLGDIKTDNKGHILCLPGHIHGNLNIFSRDELKIVSYTGVNPGRIRVNSERGEAYVITHSTSPDILHYIDYDETGKITTAVRSPYHGRYLLSSAHFDIHPKGDYVITTQQGKIFEGGPEMTYRLILSPDARYFDFVFDETGQTLFAADRNNKVDVYDANTLQIIESIRTQVSPEFIFLADNKLVLFGLSTKLNGIHGIEVISL